FRWLEGVKMRLRRLSVRDIAPGAVLKGEVLLEADMTAEIDNMEAIAAHPEGNGDYVLTLLSDDNFNGFLQRTVLLQFVLKAGRPQVSN
ncbi:MAG: esterase-like activity of phytase family protein, partial [Hyphomicrobiaceae bacterium]